MLIKKYPVGGETYIDEGASPYVVNNSYANYVPQYAGAPIQEMYMTAMKLDDTYKTTRLAQDKLETMINNLSTRDVNNPIIRGALDNAKGKLKGIRESGRWEDASWLVQQASYDFANDKMVQGALQDKAMYDKDLGDLETRRKDGKVTEIDVNNWKTMFSLKNNKQLQYDPVTGKYSNMWSSMHVPDAQDWAKVTRDFLKDANADTLQTIGLTRAGSGYLKFGTTEQISEDDANEMAMQYIAQNPQFQDRMRWEKSVDDFANFGVIDANGDLVFTQPNVQQFADRFGLVVKDGKLGNYQLNSKTNKQVFVSDPYMNDFIFDKNGNINQDALTSIYNNMWDQEHMKQAVNPAARWLDYTKEKVDLYQDWMSKLKMEQSFEMSMKELDNTNPYMDLVAIEPGTYTQLNQEVWTKALLGDEGTLNGAGMYAKLGDNSLLGQMGIKQDDLKYLPAINALKDILSEKKAVITGTNLTYGNTWQYPDKYSTESEIKEQIDKVAKQYGVDANQLGSTYKTFKESKLTDSQKNLLTNFVTTMDKLTTGTGRIQGAYKGIDGKFVMDYNATYTYDEMKKAGWDKDKMKAFNEMTGQEIFRFGENVKGLDKEGKPTGIESVELNLYKEYTPTVTDIVKVNTAAGDTKLHGLDTKQVYNVLQNDAIITGHTSILKEMETTRNSIGNVSTPVVKDGQTVNMRNSEVLDYLANQLDQAHTAWVNNPQDAGLRDQYLGLLEQTDNAMREMGTKFSIDMYNVMSNAGGTLGVQLPTMQYNTDQTNSGVNNNLTNTNNYNTIKQGGQYNVYSQPRVRYSGNTTIGF